MNIIDKYGFYFSLLLIIMKHDTKDFCLNCGCMIAVVVIVLIIILYTNTSSASGNTTNTNTTSGNTTNTNSATVEKYYERQVEEENVEENVISRIKENLIKIHPNFEKIRIEVSDESFTEDKAVIYLCIYDKDTNNIYEMNTLMYVVLHELAHVLNKEDYGHTENFYTIFDKLLCRAMEKGIYDRTKPHKDFYCGVNISNISHPVCFMKNDIEHHITENL